MDKILMLKNKEVYNITKEEVIDYSLLPNRMKWVEESESINQLFEYWAIGRKSSETNEDAKFIKSKVTEYAARHDLSYMDLDVITKSLSLTDSYWIKEKGTGIRFEEVSPYYNDFWTGEGAFDGKSTPTLYVDGYLSKKWVNSTNLSKPLNRDEYNSYLLAVELDLPTAVYFIKGNELLTVNFTSPDLMLEPIGNFEHVGNDEFFVEEIIANFKIGLDVVIFDAIIGNIDRHAGNLGFLMDTDTGDIVREAPMYDYDHALSGEEVEECFLVDNLVAECNKELRHVDRVMELCTRTIRSCTDERFKERAEHIMKRVSGINIGKIKSF